MEAVSALYTGLLKMSKNHHVTWLLGNHDINAPGSNNLKALVEANHNFQLIDKPTILLIGGKCCGFVPWMETRKEVITAIEKLEASIVKQGYSPDILFLHYGLAGGRIGANQPAVTTAVPRHVLDKWWQVFAGHYHYPLDISSSIHQVGSPMQVDFAEENEVKSIMKVHTVTNDVTRIATKAPVWIQGNVTKGGVTFSDSMLTIDQLLEKLRSTKSEYYLKLIAHQPSIGDAGVEKLMAHIEEAIKIYPPRALIKVRKTSTSTKQRIEGAELKTDTSIITAYVAKQGEERNPAVIEPEQSKIIEQTGQSLYTEGKSRGLINDTTPQPMKIKGVSAKNFMCYPKLNLNLDGQTGLYLIDGVNFDDTLAGANAIGKSTLLEMVLFARWGITSKGIKADGVLPRGKPKAECVVRLDVLIGDLEYCIIRGRKPNILEFKCMTTNEDFKHPSDSAVTQAKIDEVFGVSMEAYIYTSMLCQETGYFADLKNTGMKQVITDLRQLGKWDGLARLTKEKAALLEVEIQEYAIELERIKAKLEEQFRNNYMELYGDYEVHRKEQKAEYKVKIEAKKIEAGKIEVEDANPLLVAKEQLDRNFQEVQATVILYNKKSKNLSNAEIALQGDRGQLDLKAQEISRKASEITQDKLKLDQGLCPTCGSKLIQGAIEGIIKEKEAVLTGLHTELTELDRALRAAEAVVSKAKKELASMDNPSVAMSRIMGDRKSIEVALDTIQVQIKKKQDLETEVGRLQYSLQTLLQTENPYLKNMEDSKKRIEDLRHKKSEAEIKQSELRNQLKPLRFWEVGFGNVGIKSFLFDTIVTDMNHTMSLLLPLLSETVSARYDTEKELKGSGKRDEITLLVSDGTGEWNYNSYSGSERQKIRIVSSLALASVGYGTLTPQLFMDEPTRNLSPEGSVALLGLLKYLLESGQRQTVFLATHSSHAKAVMDGQLTVTIKDKVSRVTHD
jgi:hypothetical protein